MTFEWRRNKKDDNLDLALVPPAAAPNSDVLERLMTLSSDDGVFDVHLNDLITTAATATATTTADFVSTEGEGTWLSSSTSSPTDVVANLAYYSDRIFTSHEIGGGLQNKECNCDGLTTTIGGGGVCQGGVGGCGEVRRQVMANNRELTSNASILGPYQLLPSSYHLTPTIKESILYPPLPPSHLITVKYQKNCASCTRSHRRCIFEFPGDRQCTRCWKMHLTCFFLLSGKFIKFCLLVCCLITL